MRTVRFRRFQIPLIPPLLKGEVNWKRNKAMTNIVLMLMRNLMIGCLALLIASPLHAANKKDPAKEAQRRMQMQVKQAQDEKAAIEQEKAALGKELETLKKKTGEIESAAVRANRSKAAAEKEAEALKQVKTEQSEKIATLEKQFNESQQSLRDTRQSLQQETSQKQRLEQTLGARDKELSVCEIKNKKLYQYQVELINRAQNRGSLDVLLEVEPLTQMKRVEIENLMEEYRDKIDNEQIVKRGR